MRTWGIASVFSFVVACAGQPPASQPPADDAAPVDTAGDAAPDTVRSNFSFFVTSVGGPLGGDFRRNALDLDGLAGADEHCTTLAVAALPEAATRTWRAYLSTDAVDARDRIGTGPWMNRNDVVVATSVANLVDAAANNITKATAIDENGALVNGTGDDPVQHDILTGSLADGTKAPATCANWTSSDPTAQIAQVGHHDRMGGGLDSTSWSSAHTTNGCSAAAFVAIGGRGSLFCFAAD